MIKEVSELIEIVKARNSKLEQRARIACFLEIFLALFLSLIVSLLITRNITSSFLQLTNHISSFKIEDIEKKEIKLKKNTVTEVVKIYKEFNHLVEHLKKREPQRDFAMREVRFQENRYRQMADLLPVGLFETDDQYNLTYGNKRLLRLLNFEGINISNISLFDIVKSSDFKKQCI